MMNQQQAIQYIWSRKRGDHKKDNSRMVKLMDRLGNPQNLVPMVHVSGTNGKGSCCSMVASALVKAGYKVGLTISPFVTEFSERIQINGQMIPGDQLGALTQQVKEQVDILEQEGEYCKQFEIITAVAFLYFAKQHCDIAVIEVGMGGLYDSTNVFSHPVVCAIQSISLEHTAYLGDTISKIAAHKAGIIKPGCPVVCYAKQPPQAWQVISQRAAECSAPLVVPNLDQLQVKQVTYSHCDFCYRGVDYHIGFGGMHQVYNALTAIEVLQQIADAGFCVFQQAICQGLASAHMAARTEVLHQDPLVLVDGAHNPDGALQLSRAVALVPGKKLGVVGTLQDKDTATMASILGPCFDQMIVIPPRDIHATGAEQLVQLFSAHCPQVMSAPSVAQAAKMGVQICQSQHMSMIVCGSLYLASQFRSEFLHLFDKK